MSGGYRGGFGYADRLRLEEVNTKLDRVLYYIEGSKDRKGIVMAIKDVQDSENLAVAADDRIIGMLQTTGASLKTVSDQLAALIAAGTATPQELDALKSQIDAETAKVNAAADAAGQA